MNCISLKSHVGNQHTHLNSSICYLITQDLFTPHYNSKYIINPILAQQIVHSIIHSHFYNNILFHVYKYHIM